jgi:hypothetical protein
VLTGEIPDDSSIGIQHNGMNPVGQTASQTAAISDITL